jgi:hypothetical protein
LGDWAGAGSARRVIARRRAARVRFAVREVGGMRL